MGSKLINKIYTYFTNGRHQNIQMIVKCLKPAQINNTYRPRADTIYFASYFNAAFLDKF